MNHESRKKGFVGKNFGENKFSYTDYFNEVI